MKPALLIIAFAFFAVAISAPQRDGARIINGKKATNTPYLCGVLLVGGFWCGCSVIDKKYVLSAAHCFPAGILPSELTVSVGSLELLKGQQIQVQKIINHSKFNVNGDADNDISLLKLSKEIVYNDNLQAIALPDENEPLPTGQNALVSGFGYTSPDGPYMQNHALQVSIPVLDNNADSCSRHYKITENNFCAGNNGVAVADSCLGDSGGPLAFEGKLIGVVSYGGKCNDANAAGVYTKVSKYISWIKSEKKFYGN